MSATDPAATATPYELGEVFDEPGLPEVTYVAPAEAQQLKGAIASGVARVLGQHRR
jgi:hypothetical protein